jgi:ectonucleotide pyrophosphatase/phosphodiesterase family member 5
MSIRRVKKERERERENRYRKPKTKRQLHENRFCNVYLRPFLRLITGLYQEVHGIVSDQVYDRRTNQIFQSWKNNSEDWWPFQTIWTINEQRKGARSGVIGWPQDVISVSKYQAYRQERSFRDIINQILDWFNDPLEPINLGAIYFHEPGRTGRTTISLC